MKILLDARYLDNTFTGIGTYSLHLTENLSRLDATNRYYVLVRPTFQGELRLGKNFQVIAYPAAPVSSATLLQLGTLVDSLDVDVMHSYFPLAPLRMKTPLMVTLHDLQPFVDPDFSGKRSFLTTAAYNLFYRTVYPAVLKKAKWVLCDSFYTRDLAAQLMPTIIPKLVVVSCGLDNTIHSPLTESPATVAERYNLTKPYIIYYGSTRPNKNIPMCVKAFSSYLKESGDETTEFVLILRKDRFFRDIARVIRQEGIGSRVKVISQVSGDDRKALLTGAKCLLFASKYEGFGFPPLEAMACGVPVIAGASGSLEEVCGDAALMVNPDDHREIANAIDQLLTDRKLRHRLIEAGRERATVYDWSNSAEKVKEIYRLLF